MKPVHRIQNHVRFHRRLHDMTQQELAGPVGVGRQTILSIERGRHNPSVGLALRLAASAVALLRDSPEAVLTTVARDSAIRRS